MKTSRLLVAALALAAFSPAAHALLINYDFEGVVTEAAPFGDLEPGTVMTGRLSFDPSTATPDAGTSEWYGNAFYLQSKFHVMIGPYQFEGGTGVGFLAKKNGIEFLEMSMADTDRGVHVNANFYVNGDLFDNDPTDNLDGARWENLTTPNQQWMLNTYGEESTGGILVNMTKWAMRPMDAAPTPEPGSAMLLGSALIAWGGWRMRKGRRGRGI